MKANTQCILSAARERVQRLRRWPWLTGAIANLEVIDTVLDELEAMVARVLQTEAALEASENELAARKEHTARTVRALRLMAEHTEAEGGAESTARAAAYRRAASLIDT